MDARTNRVPTSPVDASGFAVFGRGAMGTVHVFVHRCLDEDEPMLGERALALFLRDRPARDAASVHLHWHLMVLEVASDRWEAAHARFLDQVMPCVRAGAARTDGPSGLWLLARSAPGPCDLPWEPAARVARDHLLEPEPFLAIHDALALAGAGDLRSLDAWLAIRRERGEGVATSLGEVLRDHVIGHVEAARRGWHGLRARLSDIGGSRAQRLLFERLFAWSDVDGASDEGVPHPDLGPRGGSADQILV